jgi:transaldolase
MNLYLDTANIEHIRQAATLGLIEGVTTNPSLIKAEVERLRASGQPVDLKAHITTICKAAGQDCPVSLEVTSTNAQEMIAQGKLLHTQFNSIAQNVVIKIPVCTLTQEGPLIASVFEALAAIKALEEQDIPVNATLIFTPEQALLAAKAGATYVSPFVGRVDDLLKTRSITPMTKEEYYPAEGKETNQGIIHDNGIVSGVDLIETIAELFEKHEVDCNILAASIRSTRQVREVALAGANIATIPYHVLQELLIHPKTKEGIVLFARDTVPEYAALMGGGIGNQSAVNSAIPQSTMNAERSVPTTNNSSPQSDSPSVENRVPTTNQRPAQQQQPTPPPTQQPTPQPAQQQQPPRRF